MVEAAGQLVCLFRDRLDYAFTPASLPGAGRVIEAAFHVPAARQAYEQAPILVPAPLQSAQPVYESLQGRPEVGPLPTPRRHLAPPSPARQASPM